MAKITGQETSRYRFTENGTTETLPQDDFGGKHFTSVRGPLVYTGSSIKTNGSTADMTNASTPIKTDVDLSAYILFKFIGPTGASTSDFIIGGGSAPRIDWIGSIKRLTIDPYALLSSSHKEDLSRELDITELIAISWKLKRSDRGAEIAVRSNRANSPLNFTGSFTEDAEATNKDNTFLGSDGGGVSPACPAACEFFQFGVVRGTLVSTQDLLDTNADLLGLLISTDNRFEGVNKTKIYTGVPKNIYTGINKTKIFKGVVFDG